MPGTLHSEGAFLFSSFPPKRRVMQTCPRILASPAAPLLEAYLMDTGGPLPWANH